MVNGCDDYTKSYIEMFCHYFKLWPILLDCKNFLHKFKRFKLHHIYYEVNYLVAYMITIIQVQQQSGFVLHCVPSRGAKLCALKMIMDIYESIGLELLISL